MITSAKVDHRQATFSPEILADPEAYLHRLHRSGYESLDDLQPGERLLIRIRGHLGRPLTPADVRDRHVIEMAGRPSAEPKPGPMLANFGEQRPRRRKRCGPRGITEAEAQAIAERVAADVCETSTREVIGWVQGHMRQHRGF